MASRSPHYPSIGLSKAIDSIHKLWTTEKRSPFPPIQAVTAMGFKTLNGTSRPFLGALKQYGLIEDAGKDFLKLSPLAINIVAHGEGTPEHDAAIRKAAFNPKLFKELYETFNDASDGTLKAFLITRKDFLDDGAKRVIKSFRDTMRLIRHIEPDLNPQNQDDIISEEEEIDMQTTQQAEAPRSSAPPVPMTSFQQPAPIAPSLGASETALMFKISRDSEARVIFSGPVTQEAIKKLKALLELSEDTYPTQAELEQPKQAIWRNKDHDLPVTVTGELGEHDGKKFRSIAESTTGIPEDELIITMEGEDAK